MLSGRQIFWFAAGFSAKAYAVRTKREYPEATVLGYTVPADLLAQRLSKSF